MKTILSRKYIINALLVIVSVTLTLLAVEVGYRLILYFFMPTQYKIIQKYIQTARNDESMDWYQPHPYLSYTRTDTVYAEGGINIRSRFYPFAKPQEKIRIACLGASTTRQKYTIPLRLLLHSETSPPIFEVMDFGCDGWTLQESLINYAIRVQDFSPDIIILHHGANDAMPRIWGDFKPDYTNFRTHWNDQTGWFLRGLSRYSFTANSILQRRGFLVHSQQNFVIRNIPPHEKREEPEPGSEITYRRNLDSFIKLAKKNGSHLILADMPYHQTMCTEKMQSMIEEHNQIMRELAAQYQTGYINFSEPFQDQQDWFSDAVHMTPEGDRYKAQEAAKAVWQWYWNHPERVTVDILQPNDDAEQQTRHATREIQLSWNTSNQEATDNHIYVKEKNKPDSAYLGRTANGLSQSFIWKKDAEFLHQNFQSGPEMVKHYEFEVYAIIPNGHINLRENNPNEIINIQNRISYQSP